MNDVGEERAVEAGSPESRESPEGALAGWISGIQWGPRAGLDMATRLPLPPGAGTVLGGLPPRPQTVII